MLFVRMGWVRILEGYAFPFDLSFRNIQQNDNETQLKCYKKQFRKARNPNENAVFDNLKSNTKDASYSSDFTAELCCNLGIVG